MPGVLPEDTLVEVFEGTLPADVAGDDPGPVQLSEHLLELAKLTALNKNVY